MEVSLVRKRLVDTIERAKRQRGLDRRTRVDEARRAFDGFLEHTAVPLVRQIVNVLRSEGYPFTLHTPADSVRLASDRHADNYVELRLETKGDAPRVVGFVSQARASGVIQSERELGDPSALSEDDILGFMLSALERLVER